jgi:hypothetical protein
MPDQYQEPNPNSSSNFFDASNGQVQQDLFGTMRESLENRRASNNSNNLINFYLDDPIKIKRTTTTATEGDSSPVESRAEAKLNAAFVVWKDGQVGTMVVDTPFGFK